MKKLHELQEERAALVTEMRALDTKAGAENRDLNAEEVAKFNTLKGSLSDLDAKIGRAQVLADAERGAPAIAHGKVGDGQFEERARDFSVVKAIRAAMPRDLGGGGVDDGFEREISAEVARRSGRTFEGIAVPDQVFLQHKRTLLTSGTAGDLVPNTHRGDLFIDRLRTSMATERLGATVLDGLVGTVDIPRQTGSSTAQWVAEDGSLTETDATFDDVTLSPKTVGAMTSYSRRTLLNASPSIEQIVRNDLAAIIAREIDSKAMTGTGAGNTPIGITSTAGVTEIVTGGAVSWEEMLGFIADVEASDALQGSLGWALNAYAVKKLRATPKVADGETFLMDEPGELAGFLAVVTNALAGNPNGTPTPGTAIFGDWSSLLIGYWSGVDILLNPYETTAYAKGRVLVRAMRDVDVAVRHPESFAFADDITV